jgi:hypothetical protein
MIGRVSISRLTAAALALALVIPLFVASPACAHAAKRGARGCCCSHEAAPGPALDRPMDCCRLERQAAPSPAQATPAGPASDSSPEGSQAEDAGPPSVLGAGGTILDPGSARSHGPPGPLFLLNSVFRI